jgi:hypothetical protein
MPAGSSVSDGGFDGQVIADVGNAWVPAGKSVWELSVNGGPATKANTDYFKRTTNTPEKVRKSTTYIAVTARKWSAKDKWATEKTSQSEWADVKAFDADDLDAWLEHETAVQLWFAELIGKGSAGLKSPEAFWNDWNRDVVPGILQSAILVGRGNEVAMLSKLIEQNESGGTIVIHADSSEEAAAFACAALIGPIDSNISRSAVVTNSEAWQTVLANSNIEIAIASKASVAVEAPKKENLTVILPFATGDSEAHLVGHSSPEMAPDICLQRTLPEDYRNALEEMGLDKGDAARLTLQCGRSWSVYRRLRNNNPAQRQPTWNDQKYAPVLTTMALVGGYQEAYEADKTFIETVSSLTYEQFETELAKLIRMDDAPVVKVNGVIKAKAPLELFKVNEGGIGASLLDRFFAETKRVLGQRDPQLDLARSDRWLRQIKGKSRPESGALIRSLSDSLARIGALALEESWHWRVSEVVENLLLGATSERWLSVSSYLQQVAEAAPDRFVAAMEADLENAEPAVFSLFEETETSSIGGQCWYSNLLWALESLAWAPNRLVRISRILARLTDAPNKGNWLNSSKSSLLSIFRGWKPQTCADLEMRIATINELRKSHPDQTFDLCMGMLHGDHDMATPSPRPSWRDDDAGYPDVVTDREYAGALKHAAELAFELAGTSATKAEALFERLDIFDQTYRKKVLELVQNALKASTDEAGRELRNALRHKLHWELNAGARNGGPKASLKQIQAIYDRTQPTDLSERHRWLFENHYCELPEKEGRKTSKAAQDRAAQLRAAALQEIFDCHGMAGISALDQSCGANSCVGPSIHLLKIDKDLLAMWAVSTFSSSDDHRLVGHWLRSFNDENRADITKGIMERGKRSGWNGNDIVQLLCLARSERETWRIVEELDRPLVASYWKSQKGIPAWLEGADRKFGVERLLEHDNPAAALRSLQYNEAEFEGVEIADILERNFASSENSLNELRLHDIGDLVEIMELCKDLEKQRLLRLEFQLVSAFGQFSAKLMTALQEEISTDPEQLLFMTSKAYKQDGDNEPLLDDKEKRLAQVCGHILYDAKRIPGMNQSGNIDETVFIAFVEKFLRRANEEGYTKGAQLILGKLLAYWPEGEDGLWPAPSACEVLDNPKHEIMRSSFRTGVRNKRGVTSRSHYDGGNQERALATKYQRYSVAWQIKFPLASETIGQIADSYSRDAVRHDRDAESSKERF